MMPVNNEMCVPCNAFLLAGTTGWYDMLVIRTSRGVPVALFGLERLSYHSALSMIDTGSLT